MSDERPSLPPGAESLRLATDGLTKQNDRLAALNAEIPTDRQRLTVARELWALHITLGNAHMDKTLHAFEREARARLDAAAPKAAE